MKICAACCEELTKESFSKKQWQMKQHQRRCKECIDTNRDVQRKAPPNNDTALTAGNEGASCWICLEEGVDESGQPLRRDCSCRGESAGFAHVSCIAKYAEQKSHGGCNMNAFTKPWRVCSNCEQDYQNKLGLDLAKEFVIFVDRKYPSDQPRQIEALCIKLEALEGTEGKQIAFNIISIIRQMKAENPSPPKRILFIQSLTYNNLGRIACVEGTDEGAQLAVAYFEKSLDICKAEGFASIVDIAEACIARAKAMYEGSNTESHEEMLVKSQAMYKENVKKFGQEATATINDGAVLAIDLYNTFHGIEAERLSAKIAVTCRQVHGQDHCSTKQAEFDLQCCKVRTIEFKFGDELKHFLALRYEEDGEQCVIQGPIAEPRNIQDEKTFTVASMVLFSYWALQSFVMDWILHLISMEK